MAYGTYAEYKADTAAFPGMTPGRLEKLKQLSLVSLAESTRCLEYAEVCEALDLASDEELESLVVSCIYSGLIAASLDQRARQVEVQVRGLPAPGSGFTRGHPSPFPFPHSEQWGVTCAQTNWMACLRSSMRGATHRTG